MTEIADNVFQIRFPDEKVHMTKTARMTGARVVRWFKTVRERNRSPYRWYEHSFYDA